MATRGRPPEERPRAPENQVRSETDTSRRPRDLLPLEVTDDRPKTTLETRSRVMEDYAQDCDSLARLQGEFIDILKLGLIFHPNAEEWERQATSMKTSLERVAQGVRSRIVKEQQAGGDYVSSSKSK